MENRKNRKLNRLRGYDYSRGGWYFLTICAKNREHFFGKITNTEMELSEIGKIAQKCWEEIPTHFPDAKLDKYVIMPNHIHGIIIIKNSGATTDDAEDNVAWQTKWARSLSSVVKGFKIGVTKWHNNPPVGNNNYCSKWNNNYCSLQFAWQKSYYDHIIRNENSLNKIREYIINNPLKWEFDRNNAENLWM